MSAPDPDVEKCPHHVLIVDDEEIVLVALRETFRQLGHKVSTAPDAEQGFALLLRHEFSVVITDHQMPRLTGLEFLAQVKTIQPNASRILITAVLNLTTVIDAINRAEVFRFLLKPWQREELVAVIVAAVDRYEVAQRDRRSLAAAQTEARALELRVQALEDALMKTGRIRV